MPVTTLYPHCTQCCIPACCGSNYCASCGSTWPCNVDYTPAGGTIQGLTILSVGADGCTWGPASGDLLTHGSNGVPGIPAGWKVFLRVGTWATGSCTSDANASLVYTAASFGCCSGTPTVFTYAGYVPTAFPATYVAGPLASCTYPATVSVVIDPADTCDCSKQS